MFWLGVHTDIRISELYWLLKLMDILLICYNSIRIHQVYKSIATYMEWVCKGYIGTVFEQEIQLKTHHL